MADHVNSEQSEPASDSECEADGLESSVHTSSIRVEYYRSFEYRLKWEIPMYPRRSSRLPKASKKSPQRSPSPTEEVLHRKLRSKRLRKDKASDIVANSDDEGTGCDIIDIINSTHDARHVAEEDGGKSVEVADEGVDDSDEDCWSVVNSSIASGPSLPHNITLKTLRPMQGECSACWKLYQKVKKMKAPMKNKVSDKNKNNPKSLTCDQWVLIKTWRPRRLPIASGKLLMHVQLVKKRLEVKNSAKRADQCAGEGESSACSRPHTFLQRNFRRCVRAPVKREKKKNRRKRARGDSQGPRVAKQQRLHSDNQHVGTDNGAPQPASGHSSSPGFEEPENDSSSDADLTVEIIPLTINLETTKASGTPRKQKAPKTGGFRDLLAQLRGNNSMIVRETR